jgi:hypothetical protein
MPFPCSHFNNTRARAFPLFLHFHATYHFQSCANLLAPYLISVGDEDEKKSLHDISTLINKSVGMNTRRCPYINYVCGQMDLAYHHRQ